MSKYKTVIRFLVIVSIVSIGILLFFWYKPYPKHVLLNGKVYTIEVVDNSVLLEKGLSGHRPLFNDEGMLFIFKSPSKYGFWMKDMSFPIDIIWFDENYRVVHVEESVSPDTYPTIFYPKSDSLYVLELASGQTDIIKLKIGDSLEILNNTSRNIEF